MLNRTDRNVLITGGAGFIGSNLAAHLLRESDARVTILDNFSRRGSRHNLEWLRSLARTGERLQAIEADVRDHEDVRYAAREATEIYHFAAQVAVTSSLSDPVFDSEVNIAGTLNVLEAARTSGRHPFVLFTSTNKVYGSLEQIPTRAGNDRYRFLDRAYPGVNENTPVNFYSPYGCSKGAADQYVRDYARIYGLPTVVFRMSCIAGPRQFGTEDQGWVAHFLYTALQGRPITVYGDGRQVRDVLHVADLIAAMDAVRKNRDLTAGEIFNVGGGMDRAVSVLQVLQFIQDEFGRPLRSVHAKTRPGDQPIYITDFRKLTSYTGWRPHRDLRTTLADIHTFWKQNHDAICTESAPRAIAGLPVGLRTEERLA
jgi:CDP-paratose 2-epimerase